MKRLFLISTLFVLLIGKVLAFNSGIYVTEDLCGESVFDDVDIIAIGNDVILNGVGIPEGMYDWQITGQSGEASCDPDIIVASGDNYAVDSSGEFCFDAYTIAENDCGTYHIEFGPYNDNVEVSQQDFVPQVPEFSMVGATLVILGMGFIYTKKK